MREPSRDLSRFEHILSAIEYVESYTNGISEELLKENKLYLHATTYNVQIMGQSFFPVHVV